MSYRVMKLIVGKGKTVGDEKAGQWIRQYYQLEVEIPDEHELSIAKENVEGLLNEWLDTQPSPISQKKAKGISGTWHPNAVEWQNANGVKGPYQKSVDYENPQHRTMLQDLLDHDGKLRREGYFYWVFSDNKTVGRKRK